MSKNNIRLLRKALRLYIEKYNIPKQVLTVKQINENYSVIQINIIKNYFRLSHLTLSIIIPLVDNAGIIYKYNASEFKVIINNEDINTLAGLTKIL